MTSKLNRHFVRQIVLSTKIEPTTCDWTWLNFCQTCFVGESKRKEAAEVLPSGGKLVIISYHSLEDRVVKNFLKFGNFDGKPEKDFYGNILRPFKMLTRKPILPTPEEVQINPKSRSAKLRIAEKI